MFWIEYLGNLGVIVIASIAIILAYELAAYTVRGYLKYRMDTESYRYFQGHMTAREQERFERKHAREVVHSNGLRALAKGGKHN